MRLDRRGNRLRRRGRQGLIPLRRSPDHPGRDNHNLFLREPIIGFKISKALHRAPGRHGPRKHLFFDVHGPGTYFLITCERDRGARIVTGKAAPRHDTRNVARVSEIRCNDVVCGSPAGNYSRQCYQAETNVGSHQTTFCLMRAAWRRATRTYGRKRQHRGRLAGLYMPCALKHSRSPRFPALLRHRLARYIG